MSYALVTALFQNPNLLLAGANAIDGAYAVSQGQTPKGFGLDDKDAFARTIPAIFAADFTAQYLAIRNHGGDAPPSFANYKRALTSIVNGGLDDEPDFVRYVSYLSANLAWRSVQAWRGENYERLGRAVNQAFPGLPKDEIEKDRDQMKAAAKFLLGYLNSAEHQQAAAA